MTVFIGVFGLGGCIIIFTIVAVIGIAVMGFFEGEI